jgi:F-type H+-transporting ATPase subunit delta
VASGSSTSTALTRRYVTALLSAAHEKGGMTELATGARDLLCMIESSDDLQTALASPLISVKRQQLALNAVMDAAKLGQVIKSFVRIVLDNRRGASLAAFLQATLAELASRDGLMDAEVSVAAPLNDIQQKRLTDMLGTWAGARVQLKVKVTPEVLGGIKIRLGSIQIDDSISGKLDRLRLALLGRAANA